VKIYDNVITIKEVEKEKLLKILGIPKLTKKLVRNNKLNKKIKSIYIASKVRGKYRLRSYRRIYRDLQIDENSSIVRINEKNISLIFDLKKVYYDNTYSNERDLFTTTISQKNIKNKLKIDVLYGGIGVLGFSLIRLPVIESVTIVDFNPFCKKWYEESLKLQSKNR
jgi:tRNA G37 N-methylase Trm5